MQKYEQLNKDDLVKEQAQLNKQLKHFETMGLKLDMSRGKPAPNQLDLSMPLFDVKDYKDNTGVDARNYGNLEGLPEAREFFANVLGACKEETMVGGNASLQLMYSIIDMGWRFGFSGEKPWNQCEKPKFICPVPGYDRHFRITQDFGFELLMVNMTPNGPDMDEVEKLAADPSVKGMWNIPVYSNPDGYTYSDETVERLAKMKAAPDFRIMWDNAYCVHHLTDEHETCLNLLDACKKAGNPQRALMFCSTSKITFAGAGVGAAAMCECNMKEFLAFLLPSTIGFDKMNQLRHARFLVDQDGITQHMKKHAVLIKPKFETVFKILANNLTECGNIARWTTPKGGYFISLFVMNGCAKRVVEICKKLGVVLTGAGAAFPYGKDPDDTHIRIAPTFPPVSELETAAELLCIATKLATVEKLLCK